MLREIPPAGSVRCSAPLATGSVHTLWDGNHTRCIATIIPTNASALRTPVGVLLYFHGAGGSAQDCGNVRDKETEEALAIKAIRLGFALVCGEALQFQGPHPWEGGQWLLPEVVTNVTATGGCDPAAEANVEARYLRAILAHLSAHPATFDIERLYIAGCSMGAAFSSFATACVHAWNRKSRPLGLRSPRVGVSTFATHSTGLKRKGDGLLFPADN